MASETKRIESALPEQIKFYDLGDVALNPTAEPTLQLIDRVAYLFRVYGFDRGDNFSLVINFDAGLDHSMYSEMGNIIASQFATRISSKKEEIFISPPKKIQIETIEAYSRGREGVFVKNYIHIFEKNQIDIQVILIDNLQGGKEIHV